MSRKKSLDAEGVRTAKALDPVEILEFRLGKAGISNPVSFDPLAVSGAAEIESTSNEETVPPTDNKLP